MHRLKHLVTVFGASLAVIASLSSQASAVEPGWDVNGTRLTGTAAVSNTAFEDEEVVLRAAGGGVEVKCAGVKSKSENPVINGTTNMRNASSREFNECAGNATCPLEASQKSAIKTIPVLEDITLDGVLATKGRFLPENTSKILATIAFAGTECSFAGQQALTGYIPFLEPTGQDPRTWQLITFTHEEDGSLKLASSTATILGSFLLRLVSGLPWNFL